MENLEIDIDELKAEAKKLGVKFQANIGAEKLQAKIDEFYDSQETSGKELQEAVKANEIKEKSEEKSAESGKLTKGERIAKAKAEASKTRVVTIIDNDQRVNNQVTTATVNCGNQYFDLGTKIIPLNEPVEVMQGHIDVLKSLKIPQHVSDRKGLSKVRMIPRYTISYEEVNINK